MALTRAINTDPVRYEIARTVIDLCARLHISVVVEGVETIEEAVTLRELGVRLFQGYLFAKPALERLPPIAASTLDAIRTIYEARLLDPHAIDRSSSRFSKSRQAPGA